jgi:tetratricopeptide (TPR) repeat protein
VTGLNPAPYHIFQLIVYALGVWTVYRIGRKLLPGELAAFAGALLWALHPSHVEAVAWASATPDIECGLFCLLGFAAFLRAEAQPAPAIRHHLLAAAVFFPALFFKEFALTFPLLILVYWWCFPSGKSWWRRASEWCPYVMAVAICVSVRVILMGRFTSNSLSRGFEPRVAWAAIGLLGEHAKVFFWPVNLSVARTFDFSASLHSPWPWTTLAVLAVAFVGRRREPLLSFLLLWWIVFLAPCLDYRQLSLHYVEDQFSYLPSVGLCLALAYVALVCAPQWSPHLRLMPTALSALVVVAVLWAVQVARTIPHWRDADALIDYAVQASPNAAPVHISRGVRLQLRDHDLNGAAQEFQTALRLNAQSLRPVSAVTYDAYVGLGQIALGQGREAEALEYFHKGVRLLPDFSFAYMVLGSVYFPRGDYARAADYFRQAVRANPIDTNARFYLGTCLLKLAQPKQAAEQFHAAREVDPAYLEAYEAEARALEAAGDRAAAAAVRRAKAQQPGE